MHTDRKPYKVTFKKTSAFDVIIYLTRQVSKEQIRIYNDGLPQLNPGQLCAAQWDS